MAYPPDQQMWRIDHTAGHGALTDAARGRVDLVRIERHWEDILRIIGSVHTGAVLAHDVIRMPSRDGRPTPLGDAIAHYGRIAQTLPILRPADEPGCRRQIKVQGNLQKGGHALARKICRAGQLHQRDQDCVGDQICALRLVLSTRRSRPNTWPAARRSRHHINVLGRYSFQLGVPVSHVRPYGEVNLDMGTRLDLAAVEPPGPRVATDAAGQRSSRRA